MNNSDLTHLMRGISRFRRELKKAVEDNNPSMASEVMRSLINLYACINTNEIIQLAQVASDKKNKIRNIKSVQRAA